MMPMLACLISLLLAYACCSADFVVRESTAKAPQHRATQLIARQQPKPAAPLLAHTRHRASR